MRKSERVRIRWDGGVVVVVGKEEEEGLSLTSDDGDLLGGDGDWGEPFSAGLDW